MDETLSRFVDRTGADPALARDFLQGTNWNFEEALKAFQELSLGGSFPNKSQNTVKTKTSKPQRGLSVVNSEIVREARNKVSEKDVTSSNGSNECFDEMAKFTFVLPDLTRYPQDFSEFLRRDLIETSTLVSLEQSGHLNWWADMGVCQRLVPLATVGDGNCLLHAASLGMWGFHDRLLTLRKALFRTLVGDKASGAIKRRWRLQQWVRNMEAGGLIYTEEEWAREWEEVLRIASTVRRHSQHASEDSLNPGTLLEEDGEPRENAVKESGLDNLDNDCKSDQKDVLNGNEGSPLFNDNKGNKTTAQSSEESEDEIKGLGAFESLEEIHVFVLAHVLRRPIVVIAEQFLRDFSGDAIAPIPFGGIFLPLECPPEQCYKNPLVLTFESAHFSAVVASDGKQNGSKKEKVVVSGVPVVGPNYDLLPIHFSVDPGADFAWEELSARVKDQHMELSMEQKLILLGKYLEIAEVKIPGTGKDLSKDGNSGEKCTAHAAEKIDPKNKDAKSKQDSKLKLGSNKGDKGKGSGSWLANKLVKVGNLAGALGTTVHSMVYVAKLQANNKPVYYDKMIENYIQSAKQRFEEEKKKQVEAKKSGPHDKTRPCIAPGCQMYGTAATNYLCSGCYKTQKTISVSGDYGNSQGATTSGANATVGKADSKSYFPPPSFSSYVPYDYFGAVGGGNGQRGPKPEKALPPLRGSVQPSPPPSYKEATKAPSRLVSMGQEGKDTWSCSHGSRCATEGCDFYGNPSSKGYCSSCFKKTTTQGQNTTRNG
ncbi:OTU domain-containing protein 7B [Nematostella vectensis]|uniref:OTU domain-containing protein 7B n=1 Tax=Nematostella vectensis TaxID=45351 RepID=UPI002076F9F7|nr:OTU domain-containing protein 7B [Nematostella vectensis]